MAVQHTRPRALAACPAATSRRPVAQLASAPAVGATIANDGDGEDDGNDSVGEDTDAAAE